MLFLWPGIVKEVQVANFLILAAIRFWVLSNHVGDISKLLLQRKYLVEEVVSGVKCALKTSGNIIVPHLRNNLVKIALMWCYHHHLNQAYRVRISLHER